MYLKKEQFLSRKETNKAKELNIFEKDLQEEFEESISEKREEFNKQMIEYNAQHKAWKFQQTKKVILSPFLGTYSSALILFAVLERGQKASRGKIESL